MLSSVVLSFVTLISSGNPVDSAVSQQTMFTQASEEKAKSLLIIKTGRRPGSKPGQSPHIQVGMYYEEITKSIIHK